ncbi:hypothetical protein FB451DRAFT_335436 [Mycena latifolia]|nr:hypothetical protein FB451DRAFT_335436 [Mycena latifolia]
MIKVDCLRSFEQSPSLLPTTGMAGTQKHKKPKLQTTRASTAGTAAYRNYSSLPPELKIMVAKSCLLFLDPEDLLHYTAVDRIFREVLQRFRFRHINIRTFEDAFDLFDILREAPFIAQGICTLQVSVSFGSLPSQHPFDHRPPAELSFDAETFCLDYEEHQEQGDQFWIAWQGCCALLTGIFTLGLCYDHTDTQFLSRWLQNGRLGSLRSLRKLHLLPVPEQSDGQWRVSERHPGGQHRGPWDDPKWMQALCHGDFIQVQYLIITTPVYPFWPPTRATVERLVESWFQDLCPASRLQTFILHCANDEGSLFAQYASSAPAPIPEDGPDSIPPGLDTDSMVYCTGWPMGQETSWEMPTLKWERILVGTTSRWREDLDSDVYCGWGEHRYFDAFQYERDECPPSRIYGYEGDLYTDWRTPNDAYISDSTNSDDDAEDSDGEAD